MTSHSSFLLSKSLHWVGVLHLTASVFEFWLREDSALDLVCVAMDLRYGYGKLFYMKDTSYVDGRRR